MIHGVITKDVLVAALAALHVHDLPHVVLCRRRVKSCEKGWEDTGET